MNSLKLTLPIALLLNGTKALTNLSEKHNLFTPQQLIQADIQSQVTADSKAFLGGKSSAAKYPKEFAQLKGTCPNSGCRGGGRCGSGCVPYTGNVCLGGGYNGESDSSHCHSDHDCDKENCCDAVAAGGYRSIEASSILGLENFQNPTQYAPTTANISIGQVGVDQSSVYRYGNSGAWVSRYISSGGVNCLKDG